MELERARTLAEKIKLILVPYCSRIEIAGSIRRGKPEVKDIEIAAIPNFPDKSDMFYTGLSMSGAVDKIVELHSSEILMSGVVRGGERYKKIYLSAGINLDLFLVRPPAQWGVLFTIRTGPSDFSNWIVTPRTQRGALPSDCKVKDGAIQRGGEVVETPNEIDFLNFIGLGWIEPRDRVARWGEMPGKSK